MTTELVQFDNLVDALGYMESREESDIQNMVIRCGPKLVENRSVPLSGKPNRVITIYYDEDKGNLVHGDNDYGIVLNCQSELETLAYACRKNKDFSFEITFNTEYSPFMPYVGSPQVESRQEAVA